MIDDELLLYFEVVEVVCMLLVEFVLFMYFEFMMFVILYLFVVCGFDVVIFEVGFGGWFDVVNIIDIDCVIVMSIDIDYIEYFGDMCEKIVFEKVGIFCVGKLVICGDLVVL